jgi:CRISPR-associated endonuclease/helicase Cas3
VHSSQGAVFAEDNLGRAGRLLAYLIAGHHAGLADWYTADTGGAALTERLAKGRPLLGRLGNYPDSIKKDLKTVLKPPERIKRPEDIHLWVRMLYSCLVDADFLDTENFISSEITESRGQFADIAELSNRFFLFLNSLEKQVKHTPVNVIRSEIRKYCESAAEGKPGFFSLAVPTGGGKTLSSMAFAFKHALKYGKKRIIYVIPYTSIIEQTAKTMADILGAENVVEHHSNFEPENETQRSKLACENWDAPVIVTTNVQFFESLYAARSSRCRKLHNISESVIILDEAQLLPPELRTPCVDAMRQLVLNYGATMVISTATQPVFNEIGVIEEIIPGSAHLYERLKRTDYIIPSLSGSGAISLEDLALELQKHERVLCIVNTRADCYKLFKLMPKETIHLSALMCGAHRSEVIAVIKEKLSAGLPVRVISTQLVEAGVDMDFPVVYRALAGLDSIAQAAGRCNREGKLNDSGQLGRVYVFVPPTPAPRGLLLKGENITRELLAGSDVTPDSPEIFKRYFELFYSRLNNTGKEIMELLVKDAAEGAFQFRTAAEKFKLIDNYSRPVVVRYGKAPQLLERLRISGPSKGTMRGLQRYIVNVSERKLVQMAAGGGVSEVYPGVWMQAMAGYNPVTGLDIFSETINPEDLMA